MSKKKRRNATNGIVVMVLLLCAVLCGIAGICVLLTTDIVSVENPIRTQEAESNLDYPTRPGETQAPTASPGAHITGITVEYEGDTLYAGGQAIADCFSVYEHYSDGTVRKTADYTCPELSSNYRLQEGFTTFHFSKGEATAEITLSAISIRKLPYAPNYLTVRVEEWKTQGVLEAIEMGEIKLKDYFENVAFTGDSQIRGLPVYNVLPDTRIIAKNGVSYEYLEKNLDNIVTLSLGCKALVVHYGINSLSTNPNDRTKKAEQYKALLLQLKQRLPGTRIIVSGLFPVASRIFSSQERFAYIADYNYELCEMCMEIGVDFVNDSPYLSVNPGVYAGDGIHQTVNFYTDYWLKNLISSMGV